MIRKPFCNGNGRLEPQQWLVCVGLQELRNACSERSVSEADMKQAAPPKTLSYLRYNGHLQQ